MLIYTQVAIALILGIVASISDFKNKKIYNKNIIIALIISTLSYIIFFKQIEVMYIKNFIINLIITIVVSFAFFYLKIWGAGDAKLFIAIIYMIPFELYEAGENNYFSSLYLLIIIFSIAFIYVFFETLYLFIKDENKKKKIKLPKMKMVNIVQNVTSYFMGFFLILLINSILNKLFLGFCLNNSELIYITNILILFFIYRIINQFKSRLIILITSFLLNIMYYCIFGFSNFNIDIPLFIVIAGIMLYRNVSEEYNYKEIDVADLKERMILSFGSILAFYGSKVKGLPTQTDESTDSRLTKDEVESIKRWSKTAKGKEKITIVRHMPFAPFILCGEIIFFIFKIII